MDRTDNMRRTLFLCVLLGAVTIALYGPAIRCDFVNLDDSLHVTSNVQVQKGLTWESIKWAWFNPVNCTWHPLTVWSHMLDCQLFGLKPWGHHLTSVLLHALNAGLVFALLQWMTGATWRSLLVAALFAVHPLRVESVAWVAERKDVLSGFFGLLALVFYARYAEGRRQKVECRMQNAETSTTQHPTGKTPRSAAPSSTFDPSSVAVLLRRVDVQRSVFDVPPSPPASLCHLPSSIFYLLALLFFALGLMSKPMLVTLPFVLLLLDFWPLGRLKLPRFKVQSSTFDPSSVAVLLRRVDVRCSEPAKDQSLLTPAALKPSASKFHPSSFILHPLFLEKVPFFALAVAGSVVTFLVQRNAGALAGGENLPLGARIGNAVISYGLYLGKLFWPTDLAVVYPHPGHWPLEQVLLAGGLLLGISFLLWVQRRRYPFLLMGWLWYCGTLVPVSQVVQTGSHAMADRYTYLPSLGVLILVIWGVYELTRGWRYRARASWVAGGGAILMCLALTRQQLGYWKNSETLFRHALEATESNSVAHMSLGHALMGKGQTDEAIVQLEEAVQINPNYSLLHFDLGNLFGQKGQVDLAIAHFQRALEIQPVFPAAHSSLATALVRKGLLAEGIAHLQTALELDPQLAEAQAALADALLQSGQPEQAAAHYTEALRLNPDLEDSLNNLAWLRATSPLPQLRNGPQAVQLAQRACDLTLWKQTVFIGTLAAAYAEAGRFADAVASAQKACALAAKSKDQALLKKNQELLELYRARKPYHEPASPAPARENAAAIEPVEKQAKATAKP